MAKRCVVRRRSAKHSIRSTQSLMAPSRTAWISTASWWLRPRNGRTPMSEYLKQAHRVQTAIAMNPNKTAMEPKHMRTGIDMSKADMAGLVTLLISKGILTREEYAEAITQSAYEE